MMSKIFRTIAFILVLAGLLAWGVSSLAHGPFVLKIGNGTQMQGRVMENGREVSPDQIRPFSH